MANLATPLRLPAITHVLAFTRGGPVSDVATPSPSMVALTSTREDQVRGDAVMLIGHGFDCAARKYVRKVKRLRERLGPHGHDMTIDAETSLDDEKSRNQTISP
jgi:hypothetical protein